VGATVEDVPSTGPLETGRVLDSASTRAGFALWLLGDAFHRHIRRVLAEYGLKPRQLRILDLLADRGPIGQRELAGLMGIDHSILVHLLNPLEADKLIKRERDKADRRRHIITVTAAGKRRLAQGDQAFQDAEDAYFAPLSDEERRQLDDMLSRLRQAVIAGAEQDC
jgi:DNA-binding MarR family transcriptional regulator